MMATSGPAFADEVARLSHGSVQIRIIPAGYADRPDYEAATIRDMFHGRADLAMAGSRAWDEFGVRSLRALHAPLLMDDYALQERVLQGPLPARLLTEVSRLGLVGIGILPGALVRPVGLRNRLVGPADYKGLTIGVYQSRVADAVMRTLGARPVRLAARLPNVDGLDGLVGSIDSEHLETDAQHPEAAGPHTATNVDLWPRPLVLVAGARSYGRLPASQREILRTAAANVIPKLTTLIRNDEAESNGNTCRTGGATFDTATPGELRALRTALEPVYRELERDPGTRAAIESIERDKHYLAEPPSELPECAQPAETPGSAATAIDGVWRMVTDRSAARPDYAAENWGRWIYVFEHGRFAFTQENREACTWGYGTFAVDDNQMSWTFTDGGGIAPNNATNKPGEFFVFGFSAYRDTLTVTPAKHRISPLSFRAKPWRRLSTTPSRELLSKRCPPPAGALPG